MPTLNIDVNARVAKAKRDLLSLDKEVIKISKSEAILEKELRKVGDTGPKAFRKIQSAAVKQAKAVNSAALQFKQLRAQMTRLGSHPAAIGKLTSEFVRFRKEMERGVVGTTRFQKSQDRLKTVMGATKRQLASTAASVAKTGKAAVKGGKSITGLGTTLENLGSTAVLVLGPLSGVGSRLIAFGAIAKRGSILAAGFFSGIAGGGVLMSQAIKSFDELNLSLSKTEAILKATGKEAQLTSKFVEEAASRIARRTLANLEDTRPVASSLLTFRGIDAGNLESTLSLAQDVSSAGITDLANAAKLLGRVLEDPVKNMDALRRVFIQLTPLEKDQVTHLQNIGKGAEAAGIIYDILKEKVGGVGESQNTGLAGAFDRLGQSWTHLLEDFGEGTAYKLAVKAINKLADTLEGIIALRLKFADIFSDSGGSSVLKPNFRPRGGRFANISKPPETERSKLLELKQEYEALIEKGPPDFKMRVRRPAGASGYAEKLAALKAKIEAASMAESQKPEETPKPTRKPKPKYIAPSHLSKALIDINTGIKRSLIDLNAEREKSHQGFALMSPQILKLNDKFKGFDNIVKILAGDFSGLTGETLKIATALHDTNQRLVDLGRKREAETIINDTRTALEKYNKELKHFIFLHDNGYISAGNLIVKQKELRAVLESSTPELSILTSASEKFGDSLADLITKGEDFSTGLKSIFKSLVDDITKEFLKLSIINPILNGIFGASSDRQELGSQGGGSKGVGGAGGLLGEAMSWFGKDKMGGTGGQDAPKEILNKTVDSFDEVGVNAAKDYSKVLEKTNVKMGQAGASGAMNFGAMLSNMVMSMASAVGGMIGSFFGNKAADLLGFQHGGSFKVGGSGGRDSQLVAFKASPRERVSVETPNQQGKRGNGNVTYIDARGVDPGQMDRLIQIIKDLDESVEIRAINSVADARTRNTALFGGT